MAFWMPTDDFASAAGVVPRVARKALARALAGKPWHGHFLEVREVPSRGGASGIAYEVAVASLPPDLRERLAETMPASAARPRIPTGHDWRLQLVLSVCEAGPPGSDARAAQLRAVVAKAFYLTGQRRGQPVAERTLRAWIAAHEARGDLPLIARKRRIDKGKARVIAWRDWDCAMAAAGVSKADQHAMAATMDAEVRGCWAAGEASAANIQFIMTPRLQAMAEKAGVRLPEDEMARLCRMPLHFAGDKERRRARIDHIRRTDAAGWHAKHLPRVRRHRDGMRPMDMLAADVRHSDILYQRPDGSAATAKMVCFLDLATNRLFARAFLLPKGEMIRREHVLMTLRDLVADPAWGLWRGLYLYNGGEFSLGLSADDLPHLVDWVRRARGEASGDGFGTITSEPYNPQSKVIEGVFSAITRSIEPAYPGFIGGNRMAKKTQNHGREPVPMPGDEAAILARYAEMVAFYNAKRQQRGHIKGRSPNEAFNAFTKDAANPWRAIILSPGEFSFAFGPDEWRVVQPGGELHINKAVLTHPDLAAMVGEKLRVRLPILAPGHAVVLTDKDEPLLVATEAPIYEFRDPLGATAHRRGRGEAMRAAKGAAAGAAKANLLALRAASMAALPQAEPLPPLATATLHPALREAADARPVSHLPSRRSAEEARRRLEQDAARHAVAEAYRRAG